jgi:hypothetical protein
MVNLKHVVLQPNVFDELTHRGVAGESLNTVIKRLLAGTHCNYCEGMNKQK